MSKSTDIADPTALTALAPAAIAVLPFRAGLRSGPWRHRRARASLPQRGGCGQRTTVRERMVRAQ